MLAVSNHFGSLGLDLDNLAEKFRNVLEKADGPMKNMAQGIGKVERIFVLGQGRILSLQGKVHRRSRNQPTFMLRA
jgi:hypothetical protein